MSIGNIKNAWLRRLALVIAAPIVLPLVTLFGAAEGAVIAAGEMADAIVEGWRGHA